KTDARGERSVRRSVNPGMAQLSHQTGAAAEAPRPTVETVAKASTTPEQLRASYVSSVAAGNSQRDIVSIPVAAMSQHQQQPASAQAGQPDAGQKQMNMDVDAAINKDTEDAAAKSIAPTGQSDLIQRYLSGGYNRRAWLLLGERIFSHPRYAIMIVMALVLCAFDRYIWIMAPLALFFSLEWLLRCWLLKETGWKNRMELAYLALDGIATISLISALLMPLSLLQFGFYLRLARLMRGVYLLRMLRIFRFLTHDTFVYSLPFALAVLGLASLGLALDDIALYAGVVLLLEAASRSIAIVKVMPDSGRRRAELALVSLDILASMALLGLSSFISPYWVLLRLVRFFIMLDPVSKIGNAVKAVASMPEVRSEAGMLVAMLGAMLLIGSMSVLYLYPAMDLNDDGANSMADYGPFQIILFVFRLLMDPGTAPPEAYSPWLVALTILLVLSGVFLFALIVGLGANVMGLLLKELANSPLSAREYLLFAGGNEQSVAILRQFDRLCARTRRSIPSVWLFFGEPLPLARSIGRWLTVRQVVPGERAMISRFQLSGIRQLFIFHHGDDQLSHQQVVDMHHLQRDLASHGVNDALVVADAALPTQIEQMYHDALRVDVLDSAAIAARMLYQMHHCAHMPALGIRLLDVVEGETGLFASCWPLQVSPLGGHVVIRHQELECSLEEWLCACFAAGLNLMAAVDAESGEPLLFTDLMKLKTPQSFSHVIAVGGNASLWPGVMQRALHQEAAGHSPALRPFTWLETWDLHMIFLGWHEGLPAMVAEMALKHHKLTLHVFSTADVEHLTRANRKLKNVAEAAGAANGCALKVSVHAWDGMDCEPLVEQLRGCKVIMFYPEDVAGGSEDSVLELWYHQVAAMLSARKKKARWWTPPKLMVLPRLGEHVAAFVEASCLYDQLQTDVGSPDTFHDLFMARRLLNESGKHFDEERAALNDHVFRFVDAMLGDSVLVESVASQRLVIAGGKADWAAVYRESLQRGWLLVGYLMAPQVQQGMSFYTVLDGAFPHSQGNSSQQMSLLAGALPVEMDAVHESDELMFCRRGVLKQVTGPATAASRKGDEQVKAVAAVVPEAAVADKNIVVAPVEVNAVAVTEEVAEEVTEAVAEEVTEEVTEEVAEEVAEAVVDASAEQLVEAAEADVGSGETLAVVAVGTAPVADEEVLEGQVMNDSVWPQVADKRLLKVLEKQVQGSVELLESSSEDGLVKLTTILDMGLGSEVEDLIMEALTDLQNIDRVMQRMHNVRSCLQDWSAAAPPSPPSALWQEEVSKRYVMEEERSVLKEQL
ncbi:MAG: hypothetical protein R8K50_07685, partial [Mariprofundus sp.]